MKEVACRNILLGILLGMIGFGLIGGAVAQVLLHEQDFSEYRSKAQALAHAQCTQAMGMMEFSTNEMKDMIRAEKLNVYDPMIALAEATAVIASCQGYSLERFFLGEDAGSYRIDFILQP